MKIQFLVQRIVEENRIGMNCSMLPRILYGETDAACLSELKIELNKFMETEGKKWVSKFSGSDVSEKYNCPDGFVLLPLDNWHCKHDRKPCDLQATIDLNDRENFMSKCRYQKKEAIFLVIEEGRYEGFHHLPGRYLCPSCDETKSDSQQNYKYYYPWELYPLWECLDFTDKNLIKKLFELKIPLSIKSSKVCATCFVEMIKKLSISTKFENLFVFKMDFYP